METNTPKKKTPFVKRGQTKGPLLENILIDVAGFYKKSIADIKSKDAHADLVSCRRLYCYIAWQITNATLKEIGAVICREHSNVLHHKNTSAYWVKTGQHEFVDDWFDYLEYTSLWGKYEKIR